LAIDEVLDIEETIWSPTFGIKGIVDASLQISQVANHGLTESKQWVIPLELKTGRAYNVVAHQAQTLLYTLLMSDRYGEWYIYVYIYI
jgi:DNA replication ATP-dependent helicase Dna2